jgi:thiamine-monophosphate kinase
MAGESDLIEWIRERSALQTKLNGLVDLGVGDDLAILKWPRDELLLVGVDQVIDGVHFDSAIHSPKQIGKKAMNRNLSDCAAMACLPAAALAAVGLPKSMTMEHAKELYQGMREAGEAFGCPIVGGDTASTPGKLTVAVTILARSAGGTPVKRSGAKAGDGIYVTGPLGGSILGRHMDFVPRIEMARKLAPVATAMIDLSDGLSRDLVHICKASGVGAILEADAIPIHKDANQLSKKDGVSALEHALSDGEDYELLFTAGRDPDKKIAVKIGRIVAEKGIWIEDRQKAKQTLKPRGWEHQVGK